MSTLGGKRGSAIPILLRGRFKGRSRRSGGKMRDWFNASTRWHIVEIDLVGELSDLVFLECPWTKEISDRAYLELNSIALLSNCEKPPIDPPSLNWLGLQSGERTRRESGLWNTNYLEKSYDPAFLVKLGAYGSVPSSDQSRGDPSSDAL